MSVLFVFPAGTRSALSVKKKKMFILQFYIFSYD